MCLASWESLYSLFDAKSKHNNIKSSFSNFGTNKYEYFSGIQSVRLFLIKNKLEIKYIFMSMNTKWLRKYI